MGCLKLPYYEKEERHNFLGLWKKSDGSKSGEDYYPFGLSFNSYSRENSVPNKYKYNSIERQEDLNLGWDLAQYRSYEPTLGRFMQIDPVIKVHESPYAWNTNNPILYPDPTGADSTQRARALQEANRYVQKNSDPGGKKGYGYAGYHQGEPGQPIDCSGLVSQSAYASGYGYLNTPGSDVSGVQNILEQQDIREVAQNDLQAGNIVVFPNNSHIAFVEDIIRKDGKVTGYTLVHSESKGGPNKDVIDLTNGESYYVKKYIGVNGANVKYYSWDSPEGAGKTFIGPAREKGFLEKMQESKVPILRDAAKVISNLIK